MLGPQNLRLLVPNDAWFTLIISKFILYLSFSFAGLKNLPHETGVQVIQSFIYFYTKISFKSYIYCATTRQPQKSL